MITYNNQRVAVLIDTANLYHTAKHVYRSKVHFEKLVQTITGDRSLIRAIAYAITSEGLSESGFLDTLSATGIEVRTKPLITYRQGNQKADWDVGIAIDAVALAPHIDTLVIVSGDGDFAPLVRHMRAQGVRVEAAAFDQSVSQLLIDAVDWYHDLSKMSDNILINRNNPLQTRDTQSHQSKGHTSNDSTKMSDRKTQVKDMTNSATPSRKLTNNSKVSRLNDISKTISEQEKLATMRANMKSVSTNETATLSTNTSLAPTKRTSRKRPPAKKTS